MSRSELEALILDTADRTGDTSVPITSIVNRANTRIGRDVRARENGVFVTLSKQPDNSFTLPADFQEIAELSADVGGYRLPLQPASLQYYRYQAATNGSQPQVYTVTQAVVLVAPSPPVEVYLNYYAALALGSQASSTNDLLDAYEQLYLAAGMMFYAEWAQDESLLAYWTQVYQQEMTEINEARRQQRQPVSISEYDYRGGTFAT